LSISKQEGTKKLFKLVVLISGYGSNLQQFINHIEAGKIDAEISAVISNRVMHMGLYVLKKQAFPPLP